MKYILIFNGYPKSGKTTIQNEILNKYPNSYIYSSIKPVIEFLDNIINDYGSDDLKSKYLKEKSGKTNKYRNLLSNIKLSFYDFDKRHKSKISLGIYNTALEAFNVYKKAKEDNIKRVADYYKSQIPIKLYNAMYNYKVEITD